MEITVRELVAEDFAPYGEIIYNQKAEVEFEQPKDDILTCIPLVHKMKLDAESLAQMLICKVRPMVVDKLECHKGTSEILLSTKEDYILCVAAPAEQPELASVKAFFVPEGSTLVMKPSCWHWIPFPVGNKNAEVIVIFRAETVDDDLIYADLTENISIKL